MQLDKTRYTEDYREQWESFVKSSMNGTFLHAKAFYDHNPKNIEEDHSLLFFKKGKLIALLPAIAYQRDGKRVFHSFGRSTYGGIIINDKVGIDEAIGIIDLIIEESKENNINEIVIRNPFRIFYSTIHDATDYALWYRDFKLKGRELEIYIDLRKGIEAIRKRYENGTRYNIKKAWKFVTVKESNDIDLFWPILEANLAVKHGQKPVHSLAEIHHIIEMVGSEYVKFFGAYCNGILAGGCLVFVCGKKALHAQYIGQDSVYQEFRPINAIIDYVIEWGTEHGYDYFNLGTANEDGGRTINNGLFHFKEGFGGQGVLRETMHLIL